MQGFDLLEIGSFVLDFAAGLLSVDAAMDNIDLNTMNATPEVPAS